MKCPDCGAELLEREDFWPSCDICGLVKYDAETLALQEEVKREQEEARKIFGRVPTFREWIEYQKTGEIEE